MLLRERTHRRSRLLAPLAAAVLVLPAVGVASAASTTGPPSSTLAGVAQQIAAAKVKVAALDTKAEIAAERFNGGRISLASAQRLASQRTAMAAAAAQRVARMRAQVSALTATAYMNGGTADAMLGAQLSDPGQFVDRQAMTEQISRDQASTLAGMRSAQQDQVTTA